jgi:hypothetical protein
MRMEEAKKRDHRILGVTQVTLAPVCAATLHLMVLMR